MSKEIMSFDTEDEQIATLLICEPDVIDLQGQQMSKEIIREMQQSYESFKHWGIQHMDRNLRLYDLPNMNQPQVWENSYDDDISLLDSFILSSDSVINQKPVREGSWIVNIHVKNNDIWQKMLDKELTGVSVGGMAASMPVNSHSQIISAIISELSLCNKAASNKDFLLLKSMDMDILRQPYPNFHSCRLENPDDFQPDSFKTIESKTGKVNLIIAKPIGSNKMKVQAIRYPIEKYSESIAKKHCLSKGGIFEPAKKGD